MIREVRHRSVLRPLRLFRGDRDALREAALLGKAWGLTPDWIVRGITQTVQYFTGLRGLNAAYDAVDDILSNW